MEREDGLPDCATRTVQPHAERRDGFNKARRARFLAVLAATCNVTMAAKAAGVATTTPYQRRKTDLAFDALWRAAIVAAYERMEAALMARAMGTDSAALAEHDFGDPEAILPEAKIDAELALKMMDRHRATAEGRERQMRAGRHVATEAETNAALVKQLAALRRRIERGNPPPETVT